MAGMMEGLSTVNSFLRTVVAMVVVAALGAGGWYGYTTFNAQEFAARQKAKELEAANEKLAKVESDLEAAAADIEKKAAHIAEQKTQIDNLNVQVKKLDRALRLLKVDHRVARLTTVDQTTDESTGEITSLMEFVELNDEGQPIDTPRQFRLRGDTVYIDAWVVKFDDKYVEEADIERGTSLILFKRLFGSGQKPEDGFPLDQVGAAPRAYARGGQPSDFEKKIFDDFWSIANEPAQAEQLGIRALHGDAVSMKVQKGKTYKVMLRASDGPAIVPDTTGPVRGGGKPEA